MRASQVAHTSTEICNWSTDPSVRNILTVEVRTDTSCTDELLGSSCGDFTIWSSTLEVPYAFQRWRNKLFASGFDGRLLPTFVGYPGLQMWWLGSHQLSPRKVAASVRDRTEDLSHDRPRSYQDATGASLKCCSIVISKKLGKLIGWEEQQRRYWVPKWLIDSVIWWFNFKLLRQWTN